MATQYTAGLSAGQVLTAATMNSIGAAWETWTPTITQLGNVTFTQAVTSRYARIQKIVFGSIYLTVTGTGTTANSIRVSLPVTASQSTQTIGNGFIYDASTTNLYTVSANADTTTTMYFFTTNLGGNPIGIGPAFGLANSDQIRIQFMYEAA